MNPSALTFIGLSGSAVLEQTISVANAAGVTGPVAFTLSANSTGNWLLAPPMTMTTPATVKVTAFQPGLTAGIHSGAVTITPAAGTPVIIPVTLAAAGAGAPASLSLFQTSIVINHEIGTAAPALQIVEPLTTGNDG